MALGRSGGLLGGGGIWDLKKPKWQLGGGWGGCWWWVNKSKGLEVKLNLG